MANIPTIIARPGIDGSLRTNADPKPDIGLAMASRALNDVSDASLNVAATIQRKKDFQSSEWVAEASATFPNAMAEWQAKPENHTKESYADELRALGIQQQATWLKAAPSEEARKKFKQATDAYINKEYRDALLPTERNRQIKADGRLITNQQAIANTFLNQKDTPADAVGNYFMGFDALIQGIDSSYGDTPALAEKKREETYGEMVSLIGQHNIDAARAKVESAKGISETFRERALNHLKAEEPKITARQRNEVAKAAATAIDAAENTGEHTTLDPVPYQKLFGEDGDYWLKEAQDKIDGYSMGHGVAKQVGTAAPGEQTTLARAEIEKLPKELQPYAAASALKVIDSNLKVFTSGDYVQYLHNTDPRANELISELARAGNDPSSERYRKANKDYYDYLAGRQHELNVPQDKRRMFPKSEANAIAATVSAGDPKEILKRFDDIAARFQDPLHEAMAVNDLIHNEHMPPAYAPIIENRNQPFVEKLVAATRAGLFESKALTAENRNAIKDEIDTNPDIAKFAAMQIAISPMRASMVGGYSSAIANMAAHSVMGGMKAKEAVSRAASQVINSTAITVNTDDDVGMLQIPKHLPGIKRELTEADAPDFARRLAVAKEKLDVKRLDTSAFTYFRPLASGGDESAAWENVRVDVLANSVWRNTSDGTGAVLYYKGQDGEFALTTKSGKNLVLYFDKLPSFTEKKTFQRMGLPSGGPAMGIPNIVTEQVPIQPKGKAVSKQRAAPATPLQRAMGALAPQFPGMDIFSGLWSNPRETYWPLPGEDDSAFITEK